MQRCIVIREHRNMKHRIDLRAGRSRPQLGERIRRHVINKRSIKIGVRSVAFRIAGQRLEPDKPAVTT